jgi:geranylgeranyl reductase family protein
MDAEPISDLANPREGTAMEPDRHSASDRQDAPDGHSAPDCDVAVIGGGPAGAAAAARLAARGYRTVLVDRASFPRDKVCGDFVGPMALAELADLGVTQTAAFAATSTMSRLALHVDAAPPAVLAIPEVDGIPAYGRVIPRLTLDAWIVDAARQAGATVLDGRKADAIEPAPDAITVRGRGQAGPWRLRARLLLGADGSNSMVARTLHGGPPPGNDRILAVRAYYDDIDGLDGAQAQGDIWFRSDTFPGYHWLFPTGGASANLGVGMAAATYPRSARNLREMLLRLIAEDGALRDRLRGARMRGKVLGHPLTTYHPTLPLVGNRIMLLGDAAGLINPLNGEGIQYALHSARWAADIAAERLAADRLAAADLRGYQQRVHQSLRTDMALSRLIVQLIRNRSLNHVWLSALSSIAARAQTDPDYAHHLGCVLTGLTPAVSAVGTAAAARIFGRALVPPLASEPWRRLTRHGPSARPTAGPAEAGPGEFTTWAAGTARSLAELTTELTRASLTRRPTGAR